MGSTVPDRYRVSVADDASVVGLWRRCITTVQGNGGAGGSGDSPASNGNTNQEGGAGGSASGGDVHRSGGHGGAGVTSGGFSR